MKFGKKQRGCLTVPVHRLLSRHLALRMIRIVLASELGFEAGYWRCVSLCELGMFFDDALNSSKVELLEGVI